MLVFIVLPIAEIYVIIKVGEAIGAVPTIALLIGDAFLGAALLRSQGRAAWRRFNQALAEGRVPGREIFDGDLARYNELISSQGGLSALLFAARQGYTEVAMALLDAGADVNQPNAGDKTTPLLMSIINGHYDLAMKLIERGGNVNAAACPNLFGRG